MKQYQKIQKKEEELVVGLDQLDDKTLKQIESNLAQGKPIYLKQSAAWQGGANASSTALTRSSFAPVALRSISEDTKEDKKFDRLKINQTAWDKYKTDAFVGRSVDDVVGRITGEEFDISSKIPQIDQYLKEVIYDPRNELYSSWCGYVTRKMVESELFLNFTVHKEDGFSEIDVIEPPTVEQVLMHPKKRTVPVYYGIKGGDGKTITLTSIYCAYLPELEADITDSDLKIYNMTRPVQDDEIFERSKETLKYKNYVVSWRSGVKEIARTASHLRTVFEPLDDFKEAKKWRFEYMKALSTYFIFYKFTDLRSWLTWLSLTDEQKRETGMAQALSAGDRLFCPPGVEPLLQNPNLPRLSGEDEDMLKWISSGLRQPYDVVSSDIKGPTFASIKGSRTPYVDYISDIREMTRLFLINDFFKAIFFIKTKCGRGFPEKVKVKEVVEIKEKKEVKKFVEYRPEHLIDITFPQSINIDMTDVANASLGSKRGSITYHLGISKESTAKKMGFSNYGRELVKRATEIMNYPEELVGDDKIALDNGSGGPGAEGTPTTGPKKKTGEKTNAGTNPTANNNG